MRVPFIDLARYESGFVEDLMPKVETLLRKTQFIGGPEVEGCEQELARATESSYAVSCANGTDALQLMLRAVGVGPGDKVIVPDMTFWATFEAVVNVGAAPVTVDVDRKSLHLSAAAFSEAIDRFRPKAAFLVHLYGWAAPDTDQIRLICRAKGVRLVEDCAQAFGTRLKGKSLIAGAELASTSFYPAKVLGASGDAGAVFTNDESLAKKLRVLSNHGRSSHYSYSDVGWNSRMGTWEAVFLRASLKHLDKRIESRRQVCASYREQLKNLPLAIQGPSSDTFENGYCSVALIDPKDRPALTEKLQAEGIGFGTIYPGAMSRQEGAPKWLAGSIDHGNADWISKAVLNLPCFAYMKPEEIERVVDVVRKHFKA